MGRRGFVSVVGFLCINISVHAASDPQVIQNPSWLTLESAIQEGLAHSSQVQKAKAQMEEASWKRAEIVGAGFLPKLSVSGTHYLTTKYSVSIIPGLGSFPGFYPNTTFSADLSIPIFDGLANVFSLRAARLYEQASYQDFLAAEFQLKQSVELSFYQALAADQLDAVSDENVKTLEEHLRQVKLQKEGGSATQYDVLRVEVQLSDGKADAMDAKDAVILSRRKLTETIGLDADERPLQGVLPVPDSQKVAGLKQSEIVSVRNDIQALNLRADAVSQFHGAQYSWVVPTVWIGSQLLFYDQQKVNFQNSSVSNTGIFKEAYNVALFLKWNLFDGGVSIARANQAAYQEVIAQKNAEAAKTAVPYDFEYWKRRYLSNSDHYRSKTFDISRSTESVRLAREEERAGSRTSSETLDAELDLFRAKAGAITAQVNAAEARIRLELVLGRSL